MVEVGRVEAGLYLTDKGFDSGLAASGQKLDTFGSKVDSVAQKAGQIGQSLTMGLTLPIAGAAAGVLKLSGDFQQSMANVASVTGGGVEAQKALSAAAREAGATTVFSASQAADAMYYMASAGWKDQQIVAGLNDTLKLAAAGGKDLAFTSDLMTATISQFGLGAEDAGRVANVFAAATSNSQANLDKLAYSMRYVGPIANSLGWSLEETTGGLMGLYNAGFKGEQAGTVLRGALSALLKPSDAAAETLKQLGLSIEDVNPATHSLAEIIGVLESKNLSAAQAVAIFGQEAGPGMLALLGQGQDALEGYTASITGTSKATEMMETQTNTLWGALKQLRSAGEELALVFGDVLIPPLTSLVKDTITPFVRKLGEMDSGTVKLIATIAGLAAVVGPALIAFSMMLPAITLLLSPLGLLAAGLAALFVGSKLQSDWKGAFNKLPDIVKTAFREAVSGAKAVWSGLRGIANDVASWLRAVDWGGVWDTVVLGAYTAFGALHDLGDYILEGFQSIDWGGIWTELRGIGSYIVSSLKSVDWSSIASTIGSGLRSAFETLTDLGGAVVEKLKEIDWRGVGDTIIGLIGQGFGALSDIGSKLFDAITSYDWSSLSDRITSGLADVGGAIGSYIKEKLAAVSWGDVGHRILDGIKTVFGAARDLGDYLADAIEGYDWSPVGETVAEWLKKGVQKGWDLLQWIGERVVGISQSDASSVYQPWFDAVIGAFSEFWSGFTDEVTGGKGWTVAFINVFWEAFDKVSDLLWRWGGNYYNSLRSQIIGWLTQVDAFAIEFANLFILSYDTVLIELGEFYLRATRGYSDLVKDVTTTLDKLGEVKSFDDLRSLAEGPMNYVKGLIDSLKSSVDDLINSLTKLASGDFSGISDIFSQKFNYTVVGRTSGDIYGHKSMTEAEAEQYQQEHPQFKLVNKGPSQGLASTITNPFASIPYKAIDLTTNPVESLAESGQLAEFTSIMDKLNSYQNPLASAIANNEEIGKSVLNVAKFWANPVAGAVGAATSRWYGSQFSNLQNFPTEGGQVDLSALYGKAQGSVMASAENPMLDYLISPIGINQEQQLANIKAMFPEWKGSDEELVSELSTIRSEVEAYASDSIEQQSTTAINTGSISSQMGAMPANLQGWLSSSSQQPQGAQPGQIISRESVAGFANAVIYAISPETGKLTAYIGSAGKQFEQSVGAGAAQIPAASQSFVRSVDKSVSSIYSGSKKSSAELIYGSSEAARQAIAAGAAANVSLRDGGYAALGSLVAGGQSVSSALTTSSQSAATSIISSAQTSGSILSNYSSISAGKILTSGESLGMIVSNSGYSWGNAVSSAAEVQKSATSESGATWKTAVDESGSTIRGAADSIGNAAGAVIGSLGSVLGGVANLVGGGYMSGGGSVSGTGYSAGGEDFGCEICTPMHGYNALIYTAPNGTTYAINPMTLQAQGGISGSIASGSAKVIGGYSSSKGSSSSKIISSSSSYKPILSHYSRYAEGGVVEGPQLALVGDNPSGREAIIPEEVWGGKGGAGDVTVIVEMDSRQIAKAVMPRAAKSIRIRTNSKVN